MWHFVTRKGMNPIENAKLKTPMKTKACKTAACFILWGVACGLADSAEKKPLPKTSFQADSIKSEAVPTPPIASLPKSDNKKTNKKTPAEPKLLTNGFLQVSFDWLASFDYKIPLEESAKTVPENTENASQIPQKIRNLDEKEIALKGFMLPLKMEKGRVTEFLIMRDQSMCCYGTIPKINEWVSVKMKEKGAKPVMEQIVTMFGKLRVGEIREDGYLVGIYEMEGYRMDGPKNP